MTLEPSFDFMAVTDLRRSAHGHSARIANASVVFIGTVILLKPYQCAEVYPNATLPP